MWSYLWEACVIGVFMYFFAEIVAEKVARKVLKEVSEIIDDKIT